MSEAKYEKTKKKQLGQFMTPNELSKTLINQRQYKITDKVLEPSFGEGSFIVQIIHRFLDVYVDEISTQEKINLILTNNVHGVEMDEELYHKCIENIENEFDVTITDSNLINDDFFNVEYDIEFDYIEGNPPFGGTFETSFGEKLDKIYGKRDGNKIKKETYSFFTVKCYDLLKDSGVIGFICSDTFLTINTMKGLRMLMLKNELSIDRVKYFSEETNYGMVYFQLTKNSTPSLVIDGEQLPIYLIEKTGNYSFNIPSEYIKYFSDKTLKKYITCSSGMTTGKNELFLKEKVGDFITENYEYNITLEPKTKEKEIFRNKLGKLTKNKAKEIEDGVIEKVIEINKRKKPIVVKLPNSNYAPYNKAVSEKIYSEPKCYIYWENDGEAVYTYKKTGKWYLHGVGGKPFFKKEGLSWSLISDDIKVRYLPKNYILDSGAPMGVLNEGVEKSELYFIIGWLLSDISTKILKNIINHTKNIQSKDIERLPYPFWVKEGDKKKVIRLVKQSIEDKMSGDNIDEGKLISTINQLFVFLGDNPYNY